MVLEIAACHIGDCKLNVPHHVFSCSSVGDLSVKQGSSDGAPLFASVSVKNRVMICECDAVRSIFINCYHKHTSDWLHLCSLV